ncbi:MAG: hypothetical protein ACI4JJ_03285 [Huintestinicola sp.]
MSVKSKSRKKKSINIFEGIIIAVVILLIACMLFMYFTFRDTQKAADVFGFTIYQTKAVNMEPKIPSGTAVICKKSENDSIKVGSAVLCRIGDDTVVSRVQQIISEDNVMSYVVKFDTAPENEAFKLSEDKIIAKAMWTSDFLGKLLSFATSTLGIMLVIIIPSFLIIVLQVVKIINTKRAEEEAASLEDLEEIMLPEDDENSQITFLEPKISDTLPEEKPQVLTVDKNGKAGFGSSNENASPLFTYDNVLINGNNVEEKAKTAAPRAVKPTKLTKTQDFFDSYAPKADRGPLFNESGEVSEKTARKTANAQYADYLSNVLPEKLADTASGTDTSPVSGRPSGVVFTKEEPVQGKTDKRISSAEAIPEKAVVPAEKLAPPRKKSNSKTLSELMSMIDAEENKLKK